MQHGALQKGCSACDGEPINVLQWEVPAATEQVTIQEITAAPAQTPKHFCAYHSGSMSPYGKEILYSFHLHFTWFRLKIIILKDFNKGSCSACFCFKIKVMQRVTHGLRAAQRPCKDCAKAKEEEVPSCPAEGSGHPPHHSALPSPSASTRLEPYTTAQDPFCSLWLPFVIVGFVKLHITHSA